MVFFEVNVAVAFVALHPARTDGSRKHDQDVAVARVWKVG